MIFAATLASRALSIAVRRTFVLAIAVIVAMLAAAQSPVHAMKIQPVKSPGGIEAWLVEEHSVPLMAMRFSFEGGSSQDPIAKPGLANFMVSMLDEGAGDIDSRVFHERMEDIAMRMSFEDGRDQIFGSFETLTTNRAAAIDLLRLALTRPRFEEGDIERIRGQILTNLAFADKDPNKIADKAWNAAAFPGHAYGRPTGGTLDSVKLITRDDLVTAKRQQFARSGLKVVVVGDIDAKSLGALLDTVFGELPLTAELVDVPKVLAKGGGELKVVEMPVPQSVAIFGLPAMARKDPDFMAAFVLNQILGGGGFASRLMEEVREKRGLAYSVYSYLAPYRATSLFAGGVATKNDQIATSLKVIKDELKRMVDTGVTQTELDNAKSFLTGSYALRFDTNSKIATQLLAISQEGLGIDYVERRNAEVTAVTMDDLKRVAKRLLQPDQLLVTVVGQPVGLPPKL
jgi:zinc protease